MEPLPLIEPPRAERADAARNRERILAVAREMFACREGSAEVSMDEIATRAGVGKGTLYRRFGDKAGLALALLDEDDRALQERMIRGAPPLGPGALARQRLHAFGAAYMELLERHGPLLAAAADTVVGLRSSPPWQAYRMHLVVLLTEAAPTTDVELGAEMLLDTLRPADFQARRAAGVSRERLQAGWCRVVDGWIGDHSGERTNA